MTVDSNRRYHNVMENLVTEEVRRQLASISPRLCQYIKRAEVETYALNRLPPLYASCKEGWTQQLKRGRDEFSAPIKTAVRQGIIAVQRDLLRNSTPLSPEESVPVKLEGPKLGAAQILPRHPAESAVPPPPKLNQKAVHHHRAIANDYSHKEASIQDGWMG
ncbi:MAG: late competence development ComFB family protein [Planktothrix sp. GU0601_MAG3]|nr:MAG: late competence development ComFB family protein [Planktothrix sp. GU0601_MAG3]